VLLLWILLGITSPIFAFLVAFHIYLYVRYIDKVCRIFQEKPLFMIPFGQPAPDAEEVSLITADGLTLKGCYLKASRSRKGVILFGLEFGSNRWGCLPYAEFLLEGGYDIFAFEMRGQGQSPAQAGYEPLQWLTEFEIEDFQTAVEYMKKRPDADPRGIGFFGLSKGGSAGLWVGAHDPYVRCCVTDGAFATLSVVVPYMKQWVYIYTRLPWLVKTIPHWYFVLYAHITIRRVARERGVRYPELESVLYRLAPRPWLMIHGGADNYIKPDMARELLSYAGEPKEFWLVDKAKHNQALPTANGEYKRRVLEFFDKHLASAAALALAVGVATPSPNGSPHGGVAKDAGQKTVKV
jgi:uncharacterized protein